MLPILRTRVAVSLLAALAAATGCGGGGSTTGGDVVAVITIAGISQPLPVGATATAVATALDAKGAVLQRSFTWSSSNPAVASVSSGGTVTGVAAGSATISASTDGKTGSVVVTVSTAASTVATITVAGLSQPVLVGARAQAVATATDAGGAVLTRTFAWTSSNIAIATVAIDGSVTGVAGGTATISASVDGKTGSAVVTINNPLPAVTIISPASVTAGAGAQTLTVIGSGFVGTSVVRWNGTGLATTFGSSTRLTAQLPAGNIASAGSTSVTVFTPGPGGGTSASSSFTVSAAGSNPVPAITALVPASVPVGGAAFALTVTGTNFIASSTVQWNGAGRPTTFVSTTQLVAQITAADLASAATVAITVISPAPGGGTAVPRSFPVYTPLPTLTYSQLPVTLVAQLDTMISADAQNAAVNITSPGLPRGVNRSMASPTLGSGGPPMAALRRANAALPRRPLVARINATGDCPIISPAEPAVNAAGLPLATVTYTFTLTNCVEDAFNSRSGVVTLMDPNPGNANLDYTITATNFDLRIGDSTGTIEALINAVDSVRNRNAGVVDEWLTESQGLDETGDQFGRLVDTISLHTVYSYSPSAGQLVYNSRMFPGTIVMDQSVLYVIAPGNSLGVSGTFMVVTSTLTPLRFDPTCQSDIQFTGGVLQSTVAGRTTTTTYNACNTPPTIQ